jgi:hypothetical protein
MESPYKTPEGGLLLHWIFSVILISVTAAINNISDAISFPGSLQAYATGFVGGMSLHVLLGQCLSKCWDIVLIGIGFPFLGRDEIPAPTRLAGERDWATDTGFFHTPIRRACLSAVYIVFNSYIVIVTFLPPYQNPDGTAREIKGWVYPAAVGGTILGGFLYYCAAFSSSDWSLLRPARAKAEIDVKDTHDATYGCRKYVKITLDDPVSLH